MPTAGHLCSSRPAPCCKHTSCLVGRGSCIVRCMAGLGRSGMGCVAHLLHCRMDGCMGCMACMAYSLGHIMLGLPRCPFHCMHRSYDCMLGRVSCMGHTSTHTPRCTAHHTHCMVNCMHRRLLAMQDCIADSMLCALSCMHHSLLPMC